DRIRQREELPYQFESLLGIIGWGSAGTLYEDEIDGTQRDLTVRIALQEIADAQGDVDAYIAQQSEKTRKMPMISADRPRPDDWQCRPKSS
ncbi:DUF6880 family protein, partial [Rhizobium ruizarguesonis]